MIDLINLSVQFSGEYLFEYANIKINKNDKIALVGANGTGKTTLLRIIAGFNQPEAGDVQKQKSIKIGYLPQEFVSFQDNTLFNAVKSALQEIQEITKNEEYINSELKRYDLTENRRNLLIHQLGDIQHRKEDIDFYGSDANVKKILTGLGFSEKDYGRRLEEFSGGWLMRVELAKILLQKNDLIMLDEPTNHLDIDSLQWLIDYLENFEGALIIVSHDRYFINKITNKTLEIFDHKVNLFNSNYDNYLKFKDERDRQLEAMATNQQKRIKEIERFIERFRYKNTKSRQVQSRIKMLEKIERIDLSEKEDKIDIKFPAPPRSGAIPIELKDISKIFGSITVFEKIYIKIERGEKIAVVGPNGAGKTTLAKIIANKLKPDKGEVIIGYNTFISYYAQEVTETLNLDKDIIDTMAEVSDNYTPGQLRNLLGSFLFSADDIFKKVRVLSGGEKSRVALARILLIKANFIILDEPTNHLDYSSKKILQEALINFPGNLILVSHDIDFLRPIISKVFEVRNNNVKCYYGGIDYYLEKKKEEQFFKQINTTSNNQLKRNTRKDMKRTEAEKRQLRYNMTKDIKEKIQSLEENIVQLESQKSKIEHELTKEEIFSNPEISKMKNSEYEEVKNRLTISYSKWTFLIEELEEIENNLKRDLLS